MFHFKRRPDKLTLLVVDYINSVLPEHIRCGVADNGKSLRIFGKLKNVNIEFDGDNNKVLELTYDDKHNINVSVIVPSLKTLDAQLEQLHSSIKETLSKLE